jgi:arsenite methyltransferase
VSQISFGRDLGEQLERAYVSRDILRRRAIVYEALRPQPGQRILDAGCGPGFYVAELAEKVGPGGLVVGVDRSADMLELAAARSAGRTNVEFREGDATALPVEDEEFDAVVSVQMLEYVTDVDAALTEIRRALRPGGRVALWAIDWSTVSWHSHDPARMQRVLDAWDHHLADPVLPRTLGARLAASGFEDVATDGFAFVSPSLDTEGYAGAIFPVFEGYLLASAALAEGEAAAWAAEQRDLDARGEFFFACVQFCFGARKPEQPESP